MTEAEKDGYQSYKITIGSKAFEATSAERISTIDVVYRANKIPYAIVTFIDGDPAEGKFDLSSSTDIEPGAVVTIALGYKGVNKNVFKGVIVKHSVKMSGGRSYTYIECKDPVVKMTIARKNRVFGDGSAAVADNDNFSTIFSDYGLSSRLEMKGTPYISQNSITQFSSTDWDFVLNRAEVNGKMILVKKPGTDYGKVSIDNPLATGSAVSTYEFGINIMDFDLESNAISQIKEAEAATWKEDTQEQLKSTKATSSDFTQLEKTGIKFSDLNTITSPSTLTLFHGGELVKAEIDGWSKAVVEKSAHSKVKGSFKVLGDNSIDLGDVVALDGLGTKFSGNIVVTGLKHQFSVGGWFTIVSFGLDAAWHHENYNVSAPPAGGLLPGVSGLQIGKVLAYADDPAGQHRVKVKLPMFKASEIFWARMLFEYAGTSRGNFFWPEADDEVLVGFLNDDPRNPVILGSLFSKKTAPTIPRPTDDKDIKAIITKSNLRIELDDVKKVVTVKTPGANQITLDDENKKIQLKDQNGNTIEMSSSGIKIDSAGELTLSAAKNVTISSSGGDVSIDGTNVKSSAKAKFEASGNAGLDLKTSAIAELKGSMVKIN